MSYWIILNGVRLGPMSLDDLKRLPLSHDTPVWQNGMEKWTTAGEIPELEGCMPPAEGHRPASADRAYSPANDDKPADTYFAWALLATVCCCFITGIVALVYSSKTSNLNAVGDYAAARRASQNTMTWLIVSLVVGLIGLPFVMAFQIISLLSV